MKVVEGNFRGSKEAPDLTLKEALAECLVEADLAEAKVGTFVLLVNTNERFTFVTNEGSSAETACLLEVARNTVLQKYAEEL